MEPAGVGALGTHTVVMPESPLLTAEGFTNSVKTSRDEAGSWSEKYDLMSPWWSITDI